MGLINAILFTILSASLTIYFGSLVYKDLKKKYPKSFKNKESKNKTV